MWITGSITMRRTLGTRADTTTVTGLAIGMVIGTMTDLRQEVAVLTQIHRAEAVAMVIRTVWTVTTGAAMADTKGAERPSEA
mmetsp:Transcript_17705/g.41149  ORF Transcript_17705/g.41149 Transcript_17705/m.41149 type:complete len:82 (+) Transcript_17705:698-943(+)